VSSGWPIGLWAGPLMIFHLIFVKKMVYFLKKLSTNLKFIKKKIIKWTNLINMKEFSLKF